MKAQIKALILKAIQESELDCGAIWSEEAQEELAEEITNAWIKALGSEDW